MMRFLDGHKTQIGIAAGVLLSLAVATFDSLTWDSSLIQAAGTLIAGWTGVAVRDAVRKLER